MPHAIKRYPLITKTTVVNSTSVPRRLLYSSNIILWISTAKICMMLTTEVNGVYTIVLARSD